MSPTYTGSAPAYVCETHCSHLLHPPPTTNTTLSEASLTYVTLRLSIFPGYVITPRTSDPVWIHVGGGELCFKRGDSG